MDYQYYQLVCIAMTFTGPSYQRVSLGHICIYCMAHVIVLIGLTKIISGEEIIYGKVFKICLRNTPASIKRLLRLVDNLKGAYVLAYN